MSQDVDISNRPKGYKDIGWDYGKLAKMGNYREVKCRRCEKIIYEAINRPKQYCQLWWVSVF